MAGGPILPSSAVPVTTNLVFPNTHVGAGANSKHEEGLGVTDATTLDADAIWRLRFQMPPTLPTGTAKLRILSLAAVETGVLKLNPSWASVAVEEDASAATLNAEGISTVTWGTADDDQYKETKITLDADTVVAGEIIVMDLAFLDTDTTIAAVSTHIVSVIWE